MKHSIRSREMLRERRPGSGTYELVLEDPVELAHVHSGLRAEIDLIPTIAEWAGSGVIRLGWNQETALEFFGTYIIPGGGSSVFADVAVTMVESPLEYSRMLALPDRSISSSELRMMFLQGIDHPRFLQLLRATGAYQGPGKLHERQAMDAFHIWCAEHNAMTHFLTTDLKLTRIVKQYKTAPVKVAVVTPAELVAEIRGGC